MTFVRRSSRRTLLQFTRQLRVFIEGGIALADALSIIADETTDTTLRTALVEIRAGLEAGTSFSRGVLEHPRVFPTYVAELIESAETTGAFAETLENLADHLIRMIDTRSKIAAALTYPMIVLSLALVTVTILAGFVIPRFEPLFDELGSTIPLPTRILLATTSALTHHLRIVFACVATCSGVVAWMVRSRRGRAFSDVVVLRIPVVGTIVRYALLERFCRILAAAIRSGLPVTSGMRLGIQAVPNSVFRHALTRATREMTMGIGFTAAMTGTGLFPGAARQMFRVGEESGILEDQVIAASEFFDEELDVRLHRFTSLFEPALIVIVGVIVGFVAIALISAMYGVLDGVRAIP